MTASSYPAVLQCAGLAIVICVVVINIRVSCWSPCCTDARTRGARAAYSPMIAEP